jgi:hypothetical protein
MPVDIEKKNKNDAVVIGNGTSRLQFDLDSIHALYTTYGCNALYRDFMPDYLIAMDLGIVEEILDNRIHHKTNFYTQHTNRWDLRKEQGYPINFVRTQKKTVDSGNSAIDLAAVNKHKNIYMIGFDYVGVGKNNELYNNVYAGTRNYANKNSTTIHSNQTHRWLHRIRAIVKQYTDSNFIRINGNDYSLEIKQDNYTEITIEQFKEILNK